MDALERYLHAHSSPEPELLAELDRETHRRTVQPRMLSGHLQGRLLELLVRMNHPRAVLEIGTFTGYSALALAAGLDDDATPAMASFAALEHTIARATLTVTHQA